MNKRLPLLAAAALAALLLLYLAVRLNPASSAVAEVRAAAEPAAAGPAEVSASGSHTGDLGELPREAAEASAPAAAQVDAANALELVVRDPDDVPIAGATVETFDDSSPAVRTTDAEGRCQLPSTPEGHHFRVHVAREGYHHVFENVSESDRELTLFPSGLIEGRVADLDELPIAGAAVRVSRSECERCDNLSAVSDPLGRFELTVPRGRGTLVEARAEGFVPRQRSFELREESGRLELRLDHSLDLWFEVVDFETGRPIAGAELKRGLGKAATDENGRVRSRTLLGVGDQETARIGVAAEDYCGMMILHDPVGARPGEVITVRMVRAARVEGHVLDLSGAPVHDAWISVRRDYRAVRTHLGNASPLEGLDTSALLSSFGRRHVTTDEEGYYLIEGLVPWEPRCRFTFGAEGFVSQTETPTVGEPGSTAWHDVTLRRRVEGGSGGLSGTLRVAGVPSSGDLRWSGAGSSGSADIEDDGTFEVPALEVGEVTVTLIPSMLDDWEEESCGPRPPCQHSVHVTEGETARLDVDMELDVAAISGVVLDAAGTPLSEVSVWASNADSYCAVGQSRTDEEGRFTLTVLQRFRAYEVSAWKRPRHVSIEAVAPGTDDVKLVLPDTSFLEYRALASDTGLPVIGGQLVMRSAGSSKYGRRHLTGSPDPEGWYRVELEPGVYDLGVNPERLPDYFPAYMEGVRVGDEPVEIELYLERALALDLERAEGQAPLPEGTVLFLLPEGLREEVSVTHPTNPRSWHFGPGIKAVESNPARYWMVTFGDRGRARIHRLRPGRYALEAFPEPLSFEPGTIEVSAGVAPVTVRWSSD